MFCLIDNKQVILYGFMLDSINMLLLMYGNIFLAMMVAASMLWHLCMLWRTSYIRMKAVLSSKNQPAQIYPVPGTNQENHQSLWGLCTSMEGMFMSISDKNVLYKNKSLLA